MSLKYFSNVDAQIRVFKKENNEKTSIINEQKSRVMQLEKSAENERAIQQSFKVC